jgi:protein-tyrosine phosphatase
MPFAKILDNLFLGDQFSNQLTRAKELKIGNIFYDILLNQKTEKKIIQNETFVLTPTKLAIKMYDTHDISDFNDEMFAVAVKFIDENQPHNLIYTHCQLGLSRSASTIFIYLVVKGHIQEPDFSTALTTFLDKFYPYMKVNFGVYSYLKKNFPFQKVKLKSQQK